MVPVSSGTFVKHSHMMLMIKWILMFLLARMETVMTGMDCLCHNHVGGHKQYLEMVGIEIEFYHQRMKIYALALIPNMAAVQTINSMRQVHFTF